MISGEVVNQYGCILQRINTDLTVRFIVGYVPNGTVSDSLWPFEMPPKAEVRGVAAGCKEGGVAPNDGTWSARDQMGNGAHV